MKWLVMKKLLNLRHYEGAQKTQERKFKIEFPANG